MMLAAMVAMAILLAAPAMAQTTSGSIVERCVATLDQSNEGDQVAINQAEQDADASQFQYNPGGDATQDNSLNIDDVEIEFGGRGTPGMQFQEIEIEGDVDLSNDQTGGAGGTGSQYQYQNQRQVQDATATGPTFDASQVQYCSNVALSVR
jgi:hypothetical protein